MTAKKTIKSKTPTGPWNNFPNFDSTTSPEMIFSKGFISQFKKHGCADGVGIREFALQGLGIADYVWVTKNNHEQSDTEISTFEFKIKNWKCGLRQAYKYSYFANKSYLVIPSNLTAIVLKYKELFENINIGLLGFDENNKTITNHIEPQNPVPVSYTSRQRAIKKMSLKRNLSFLRKQVDTLKNCI